MNKDINDEKNWYEWIDKFFQYSLSEQEMVIFDEKYNEDATFAKEVEKRRYFENIVDQLEYQNIEVDISEEENQFILPTPQRITAKRSFFQKNKKVLFGVAASVLLFISITSIYYLNQTTKNNQKITKNKNHTDKSLDKKENTIPKIDKDSLKNEKDNVVEKKEKIEIVLPKKEKNEEKIAVIPDDIKQKFESKNRSLEAMAEDGSSRSTKSFKIIVPQNNENFKDKIIFKWEWEKENTEPMLMLSILDRFGNEYKKFEINTKEKKSSYIINISDFEPALYYFQISTTQESIPYTGRFFVRKPF